MVLKSQTKNKIIEEQCQFHEDLDHSKLKYTIRSVTDIKSIHFKSEEFKISRMADEATLFLTDIASLSTSTNIFNKFVEC